MRDSCGTDTKKGQDCTVNIAKTMSRPTCLGPRKISWWYIYAYEDGSVPGYMDFEICS
jgi:hypothetical protein